MILREGLANHWHTQRRRRRILSITGSNFTQTRYARIVVDCHDIGFRILAAQFFDNTFSDNMVWQAGEWLCADNIVCTAVDQFQHLTGQEPSFTGLVTEGYDIGQAIFASLQCGRRCETALLQMLWQPERNHSRALMPRLPAVQLGLSSCPDGQL